MIQINVRVPDEESFRTFRDVEFPRAVDPGVEWEGKDTSDAWLTAHGHSARAPGIRRVWKDGVLVGGADYTPGGMRVMDKLPPEFDAPRVWRSRRRALLFAVLAVNVALAGYALDLHAALGWVLAGWFAWHGNDAI